MADTDKNKKSELLAMARKMGISIREMREMLGLTNVQKEGVRKHRMGGMVKKKMRGGGMMKVAKKKMRGGGMMKVAKKKMMRGGVAKKK